MIYLILSLAIAVTIKETITDKNYGFRLKKILTVISFVVLLYGIVVSILGFIPSLKEDVLIEKKELRAIDYNEDNQPIYLDSYRLHKNPNKKYIIKYDFEYRTQHNTFTKDYIVGDEIEFKYINTNKPNIKTYDTRFKNKFFNILTFNRELYWEFPYDVVEVSEDGIR